MHYVLLNHLYINNKRKSNMFQPLKHNFQERNWYIL